MLRLEEKLGLLCFQGGQKTGLKMCSQGSWGWGRKESEFKISYRNPTVTVTERPEVNGRAGLQGTDTQASTCPNILLWTERVKSQKKAHTLFFSRRNHIIWVYRNGEVVSEVDFSKGAHRNRGRVGNCDTPGGSTAGVG